MNMKRLYLFIMLLTCTSIFVMGQRRITEEEWDDLVLTKPVVLDFYADWCAPCRQQAQVISQLVREFPGIDFYKVDIERDKDWFSGQTEDGYIPMIQFWYVIDEGRGQYYKSTVSGLMSYAELRDSCQAILNRYNDIQRKIKSSQKVSTNKTDTIVVIDGANYHLALSGAVDMGTGILWAAYNLDANRPEQAGGFYAWGETATKNDYTWSTYKYANYNQYSDQTYVTKYSMADKKFYLQASDDAATQKWGGKWRMPDKSETWDLLWETEWTSFTLRGTWGLLAYSKRTKNAIFFPAVGCMDSDGPTNIGTAFYIWTSQLAEEYGGYALLFESFNDEFRTSTLDRASGYSIRPVCNK